MDVIRHAVDDPAGATQFQQLLVDEVVKLCFQRCSDEVLPVPGGEHRMGPEFSVYVAHEEYNKVSQLTGLKPIY